MKIVLFKTVNILFFGLLFFSSCKKKPNEDYTNVSSEKIESVDWKKAQNFYSENINEAILFLDSLQMPLLNDAKRKYFFGKTRIAFKKAEPYAAYLNPQVGHRVNGPALPVYKEDSGKFSNPVGLQTIEEFVYDEGEINKKEFDRAVSITKGMFTVLKKGINKRALNTERFFVATHQQLLRMVSLAMAGFDTPVSQLSIKETGISLKSLQYVYENSIQSIIKEKNNNLNISFIKKIDEATTYINKNTDFISFDRFTFTRDYLNPITRNWVAIRKESGLWEGSKSFAINFDAPTFFEENSFNADYFGASRNRNITQEQIALGKKLFFDSKISKNKTMACATCHIPKKAFADNLRLGQDNSGNKLQRNTPTLINASFQKAFFWDGRAETLIGQIGAVFRNSKEFNTEVHQFSENILQDTTYVALFKKAYGKLPNSNRETINAISAYVATLNGFNSKFDKNIRGEENTFTASEKNGFNLFMGKALCATCHFMPLTNGTVPPFFYETEKEVIGVPETAKNKTLDDDLGFYAVYGEEQHRGMFKTPTIRNASLTAPYMHNGVYNTLEEVMNFYNLGGGAGLGFNLEHQTLPFDELNLTEFEQNDIIAFIKTLEDNSVGEQY